jgi:hypothetical protein
MKVIKWNVWRVDAFVRLPGLKLDHCPPIRECIHWGPQHVDLHTQEMLRRCYYRSSWTTDFDAYIEALNNGDEVLFWGEPSLGSCVNILWVLDTLATRGANLRNAFLVLSPVTTPRAQDDPAGLLEAITARVPVEEVLQPLIALRRHLASDSDTVCADLSALPPTVRDWAAVTDLMEDFLPDEHGLDLVDRLLLDSLADGFKRRRPWCNATQPIGAVLSTLHDPPASGRHDVGDLHVWERLLELAGFLNPLEGGYDSLVELFIGDPDGDEQIVPRCSEARIAVLGHRVRAGEADALRDGHLVRWVGGRMISSDRPLRRSSARSPATPAGRRSPSPT